MYGQARFKSNSAATPIRVIPRTCPPHIRVRPQRVVPQILIRIDRIRLPVTPHVCPSVVHMHVIAVIPVRACIRRGGVAADNAVDHRLDGHHLPSTLAREIQVVAAPPVPAAAWVGGRCGGLRVQDDHLVGVGPAVVAGALVEGGADRGGVLQAAVEGDVEFAGLAGGAAGRDVGVAAAGHAVHQGIEISPERGLVEVDEDAAQGADVFGVQGAVEPVEDFAGGIVIAVVDERAAVEGAQAAEIVGGDGMFNGQVDLVEDIRGGNVARVHRI